jgi:hypothetical protein
VPCLEVCCGAATLRRLTRGGTWEIIPGSLFFFLSLPNQNVFTFEGGMWYAKMDIQGLPGAIPSGQDQGCSSESCPDGGGVMEIQTVCAGCSRVLGEESKYFDSALPTPEMTPDTTYAWCEPCYEYQSGVRHAELVDAGREEPDVATKSTWFQRGYGWFYAMLMHNQAAESNNRAIELLKELREWHKSEYQSNPELDAKVDAFLEGK